MKHLIPEDASESELRERIKTLGEWIDKVGCAGQGAYWLDEKQKCENELKKRGAVDDLSIDLLPDR